MLRRITMTALLAMLLGVSAQTASADPSNAKNAGFFTAVCGSAQLSVVVNGNGAFTPAHVIGSTSLFIPTAFDLTFSFTPSGGGAPEIETNTSARSHQPSTAVTCELPAALNTVTFRMARSQPPERSLGSSHRAARDPSTRDPSWAASGRPTRAAPRLNVLATN